MKRNITIDLIRTLAIVLMIIFHFLYDLTYFNLVDWNMPNGEGWRQFRWIIITLFFLCLGVSLTFVHHISFKAKAFSIRILQISLGALVISIATYFAIPKNWIFFGVLHFLALSSVVVLPFVRYPLISLIVGGIIMLIGMLQIYPSRWPWYLLFDDLPRYTNDYVAILPWLGMVFWGVPLAHWYFFKFDPFSILAKTLNQSQLNKLTFLGRHGLIVYLVHQPIIMGGMFVIIELFEI